MSEKQTIVVNGRHYDARTGLAVDSLSAAPTTHTVTQKPVAASKARVVASAHVHNTAQRSQTLNRRSIKRPVTVAKQPATASTPRRVAASAQASHLKSAHIAKFAKHPVVTAPAAQRTMDIGPVTHPHVAKAHAISHAKAAANPVNHIPVRTAVQPRVAQAPHKPAQVIKNETLKAAVENTHKQPVAKKQRFLKRHPRALSIVTASLALVLLGGYLTYLNMPTLSVRVAAAQAGINANYPNYRPDGYSLNGPVAYNEGQVTMKFAANGGPQAFTIKQMKSSWDSAAVLDNYVTPKAGVSYIPYTERGLTIYAYGGNAAWVNGGILYTIEGNAPLSSDQLRRIATSLI